MAPICPKHDWNLTQFTRYSPPFSTIHTVVSLTAELPFVTAVTLSAFRRHYFSDLCHFVRLGYIWFSQSDFSDPKAEAIASWCIFVDRVRITIEDVFRSDFHKTFFQKTTW